MPLTTVPLVLASQSPRRRELLEQVGLQAEVRPGEIDETPGSAELPADYVLRMAREKALACPCGPERDEVILAADTAVVVDDIILGKPRHRGDAAQMLARLSNREHRVLSAFCLRRGDQLHAELVATQVRFVALDEQQIQAYLASGEADDKAGAYGIQGRAAAFVSAITGSYSSVVGLPLCEVVRALRDWGLLNE